MTAAEPGPATESPPWALGWIKSITRKQWNVLLAAMLGWMLDSMDFALYLWAITTLQREFNFGTETAGLLASVALVTSAVGGLVFGVVADMIGRTRALMGTILIYSLCSLGTATAQNVTQLILWRAALGFGMGGEWATGAVLVSETWPAEHRGKAIGIMQSGWALGSILAALAAAAVLPTLGWRWLFVVGVIPAFAVIWIRRSIPEPEVWSAQRSSARAKPVEAGSTRLPELPRGELISRIIKASLLSGLVMFGYWGLFTWLPAFLATPLDRGGAGMTIVRSAGWIIAVQAGAFLGYTLFGFISDRFGRRLSFIVFLLGAAVLGPIYGHMGSNHSLLMALGPLLGFFGHGYFSLFGAVLAELFPTRVRATLQGFTYNLGRGLSAFAPLTIGAVASTRGLGSALGLTSAFFAAGALMILVIPETRGKQLD
jgi:MFS family permease